MSPTARLKGAGGESKGSRRYDKENLLWQFTVAIRSDPVGSQHRESRFALEVLGEVGMRCAARLRDALDGELPRVRRTDEVNRRGDMRIRRREASSSGVVAVGGWREILMSTGLSDGGTSSRAPRRTGIPSPGL